jgi:catechol 2,3-dioxygenase-like lactoylglutathione lyase family enzyme
MITGLHHIQLAAPPGSEDRMREFYAGILGLTEIPKPQRLVARGGAWFAGPGLNLHIGIEDPFRPARKAHPAMLVSSLDRLAKELTDAGYEIVPDELLKIPGGETYRRFYADDPAGNRLEFLERETSVEPAGSTDVSAEG